MLGFQPVEKLLFFVIIVAMLVVHLHSLLGSNITEGCRWTPPEWSQPLIRDSSTVCQGKIGNGALRQNAQGCGCQSGVNHIIHDISRQTGWEFALEERKGKAEGVCGELG
jgi:hypothetical protein